MNYSSIHKKKLSWSPATWKLLVLILSSIVSHVTILGINPEDSATAQTITPAADGTNTLINQSGNQIDISGGTLSSNGANLFHSFQRFGLNQGQIANFLSNPNIQNILGRVVGGDPSLINGLIQITGGNSNLYLMNPAGIVFGSNASLNVPASFTATTANSIGFGNNLLFNSIGTNDYLSLNGNPTTFNFNINQPGSIINAGNLQVGAGENLTLIGGNVINNGTLTAPQGNITIAAVPGSSLVRISQPGNLLSIEIDPNAATGGINALTLPQLLTGSSANNVDTKLTVNNSGEIALKSGANISSDGGVAVASGNINASGQTGGTINIIGNKVEVIDSNINSSGTSGGGTVLIGGDYQGKGTIPNAQTTFINKNSQINADAVTNGDGGKVIVWSDEKTQFDGNITARGGSQSGNGGFAEVSGQQKLTYKGFTDLRAPNGQVGTLLLDPDTFTIANTGGDITPATVAAHWNTANQTYKATTSLTVNDAVNGASGFSLTLDAPTVNLNAPVTNTGTGELSGTANTVNVGANGSIQNGIDVAATGGKVNLAETTYTLSQQIEVNKSVTIQGAGADKTIVSGNNAVRIFNISGTDTNATIDGLTIKEGNAAGDGGGIQVVSGNTLNLRNSTISDNKANNGGGIYNSGTTTVSDSKISNNTAGNDGGGIASGGSGTVKISKSEIDNNSAGNDGGGIHNQDTATLTLSNNSTVSNNKASVNKISVAVGGGIANFGSGKVEVSDSTISNNSAENGGNGGGIYNLNTATVILNNNSKISNNSANNGAGIYNLGTATVSNTTLSGNTTTQANSGTIDHRGGSLTLENKTSITGGNRGLAVFGSGSSLTLGDVSFSGQTGDYITLANGALAGKEVSASNVTFDGVDVAKASLSDLFKIEDKITHGVDISGLGLISLRANNLFVTKSGSIQRGINTARDGDTINIAEGTYTLSQQIEVNKSVTLQGAGADKTIVSGNNAVRVFNISGTGTEATLNSLTISKGQCSGIGPSCAGAGIYVNTDSKLDLINSEIYDNFTENTGGGIYNAGTLTINTSKIYNNTANINDAGGGIYNASKLTISNSEIYNNKATQGGGIGNQGTLTLINNSKIHNNEATRGGGIANFGSGTVNISNTIISDNKAGSDGGGIANYNSGTVNISNTIINDNKAGLSGGGIYNQDIAKVILSNNNTISNNKADNGGGIYNLGTATVSNTTLSGNTTTQTDSGTIDHRGGSLTLENKTSITGGSRGLAVFGSGSSLTLGDVSFSGQTGDYITLANGALAGKEVSASSVTFDGVDVAKASQSDLFKIEDKITNGVDGSGLGLISLRANNLFVTKKGSIQSGINAARNGYTINISQGTYDETININKPVNLAFDQAGVTLGQNFTTAPGVTIGLGGNLTVNDLNLTDKINIIDNFSLTGKNLIFSSDISTNGNFSFTLDAQTVKLEAPITNNNGAGQLSGKVSTVNVGTKGLIQNGIDFAVRGGKVNITAGNYNESIIINKPVNLAFDQAGVTLGGNLTTAAGGTVGISGKLTANDVKLSDAINLIDNFSLIGKNLTLGGDISTNGNFSLSLDVPNITINAPIKNSISKFFNTAKNVNVDANGLIQNAVDFIGTGGQVNIKPGIYNQSINVNKPVNFVFDPAGVTLNGDFKIASGVTIGMGGNLTTNDLNFSNAINVVDNFSLTGNSLTFSSNITANGNSSITLQGNQNITTSNITTNGGGISLTSQNGSIETGNLNSSASNNGGNINLSAQNSITTKVINSSSQTGNGGTVTLNPKNDIVVTSINTQGGSNGRGGDVTITTQKNFRATETFISPNNSKVSINTFGGAGSGNININHGNVAFSIGYTKVNGTAGAIFSAIDNALSPVKSILGNYTQGNIIISSPALPTDIAMLTLGARQNLIQQYLNESFILSENNKLEVQLIAANENFSILAEGRAILKIENRNTQEFTSLLKSSNKIKIENIQTALRKLNKLTGIKSAIIYVNFAHQNCLNVKGNISVVQDSDVLCVGVVTADALPTYQQVPGTDRKQVMTLIEKLKSEITNPRNTGSTKYLTYSQQLYKLLITPIEDDLQNQRINNLMFVMDEGLRSLPTAVLNDGKQFLIEKYSLSLTPSFSLTNTEYQGLKDAEVLAMGASQFTTDQKQLELRSVPVELAAVSRKFTGQSFLNDKFTRNNLQQQRQTKPFPIIHLATQADFSSGGSDDQKQPYIQLYDEKLPLSQIEQVVWQDSPVELLVLSGTNSAVADKDAELGFAGLAVTSGVKTAVASLWDVSEPGRLGLMTEFYNQLPNVPIKAEALRQAQVAMIKNQVKLEGNQFVYSQGKILVPSELATSLRSEMKGNLSHPYYWAAYNVIGSPW